MAEKTKIQIDLNIPVKLFKEGQSYVAYPPVLDLSCLRQNGKEGPAKYQRGGATFYQRVY
ncbi:MAG: hypothetical protein HYR80_00420 [Nitrospirae bacterium]|nr:hypothetical protein [Nitrospirota bacterium]MBI3803930.1 hypothetical protein [Candidatus Manganitrophaceae bacterium]